MNPPQQRGDSPPRGMQTIGLDIGETNKRNLANRRIKKGECPSCGIRTHKIGMFGKKTPISVDGECVAGRCLRCYPLEGYRTRPPTQQQPQQSPFVPLQPKPIEVGQDIIVDDDDDNMSGITMDDALRAESTRWRSTSNIDIMDDLDEGDEGDEFGDAPPPPRMLRRPEPSVGGDDEYHPKPLHSRPQHSRMEQPDPFRQQSHSGRPAGSRSPLSNSSRHSQRERDFVRDHSPGRRSDGPSRQLSPRRDNFMHTRLPSEIEEEQSSDKRHSSSSSGLRNSGSTNLSYPVPLMDANGDKGLPNNKIPRDLQYYDDEQEEEKNEIQGPSESFRADPWPDQDPNFIMNDRPRSRKDLRQLHKQSRTQPSEITFVPDGLPPRQHDEQHGSSQRLSDSQRRRQQRISPPQSDMPFIPDSSVGDPSSSQRGSSRRQRQGRTTPSPPRTISRAERRSPPRDDMVARPFDASGSGITRIPGIIRQLGMRDSDLKSRAALIQSLADIVWISGTEAKMMVKGNNGIQTIEECMWNDVASGRVQLAAVNLLFALSACSEDSMDTDIFLRESGQTVIDALLISMQSHISVESLQASGCGTLGCLASASKGNERVEDGTLSGAVSCVVAAMDAHRKSLEVQKWGIWALYCQCVLSVNSESSQRSLAKGAAEAGGVNVIFRAMDINDTDLMVLEWGCKLYWSLSFSDEICKILVKSNQPIVMLMRVLRFYEGNKEAAAVEEAAYGAMANIAREKKTHPWLRECNVISRVCQSMDAYSSDENVLTEACALIANIAENQPLKEAALAYGVSRVFQAMESFPHSAELHEEALRALLSLSVGSEDAKTEFSKGENLNLIMDSISYHQRSPLVLQTGFALVASLCVGRSTGSADMNEVVDQLIMAMKRFPEERLLQQTVCLLLRNLSCREQELVIESEDFFPCLLQIMKTQADSDTIQTNLCCVLANLVSKVQGMTCSRVDDGMAQIVAVIQRHIDKAPVIEMACTALWHMISGSEECQMSFVEAGGVEYVKNALLMHPGAPSTLERVIGVLSCLSESPSHSRLLAMDQGIIYVVETMRTHSTSFLLLEYGCIFLRNAVLHNIGDAFDASTGISTIIAALREDSRTTEFEIEACRALWVMAAQSEDCRQKILALEGSDVIMGLQSSNVNANVRDAARGAFNQLMIRSLNDPAIMQ